MAEQKRPAGISGGYHQFLSSSGKPLLVDSLALILPVGPQSNNLSRNVCDADRPARTERPTHRGTGNG